MQPDLDREPSYARGLFLSELRRGLDATAAAPLQEGEAQVREWQESLSLDDHQFHARLAAEGFSREHLARLLGQRQAAATAATAAPEDWQAAVAALLRSFSPAAVDAASVPEEHHFAAALQGFVAPAWAELRARIAPAAAFDLDWQALEPGLKSHLGRTLLAVCERTLVLELNVARLQGRLQGASPAERYRDYVQRVLRDASAWEQLFDEYPVLARLLCTTLARWRAVLEELFARLASDWELIAADLLATNERLRLTQLVGGLSDPHREGRGVWTLTFHAAAAGSPARRLLYKPKSLAVDVHFQSLLAFCNEGARQGHLHLGALRHAEPRPCGSTFPEFFITRVLDRGAHGWVEFVERRDCEDAEGAARFYVRQGAYLALLHLLDGVDLHFENVIAQGEHPVLVDLEMLFHPSPSVGGDGARAATRALERLKRSVMRTGLLPGRFWGDEGHVGLNIGGLGDGKAQLAPMAVPIWSQAETDEVHEARCRPEWHPGDNLPRVDGVVRPVGAYTEEVVAGFEAMLRFLMARREALLAATGPVLVFADDEVRRILRATVVYAKVLKAGSHPDHLRDAMDRERLLDMLWHAGQREPLLLRATPAEREDLRLGDIPFFSTRPGSRHLWDSRGQMLPDFFSTSALSCVEERIRTLDDEEVAAQVFVLRASLSAADAHEPARLSGERPGGSMQSMHPVPADSAAQAALALGEQIAERAILGERDATWLGVAFTGPTAFNLFPAGGGLYDGTAGIALFLGYLGHLCKEDRFTRLAERAARATRSAIAELPADAPAGGFSGVTSQLYALSHLSALWAEPGLLPPLGDVLDRVAAQAPLDHRLDVIYGAAGCILSLLALHEATGEERAQAAAVACARNLQARALYRGAGAAWIGAVSGRALLGFSHGTAGIACALARLARALEERSLHAADARAFSDLAEEALRYERSHFDATAKNWPDLRESSGADPTVEKRFLWAWCHGAPGIALSRLMAWPLAPGTVAREEVEVAIEGTLARRVLEEHTLCHGELGNMMIASHAASLLRRDDWRRRVDERVAVTLERLRTRGPRGSLEYLPASPELMMGTAGIGYGLLYQAFPGAVPNVLALSPPVRRP